MVNTEHMIALYDLLVRHFSLDELRTLCFRIGVDYDAIEGDQRAGKARELILYMNRRAQLEVLAEEIRNQRPDIPILAPPKNGRAAASGGQSGSVPPTAAAEVAQELVAGLAPLFESLVDSIPPDDQFDRARKSYELIQFFSKVTENDYLAHTLERYEEDPEKRQIAFREILREALEESPEFLRVVSMLLHDLEPNKSSETIFKTDVSGGTVGQVINVDRLEGGLTIS